MFASSRSLCVVDLLQIDLVLSLEGMLKRFDLLSSRFFPPIPVQRGPIFINKSFADGHYTTGWEIAEAIKPRPVSLFTVKNVLKYITINVIVILKSFNLSCLTVYNLALNAIILQDSD